MNELTAWSIVAILVVAALFVRKNKEIEADKEAEEQKRKQLLRKKRQKEKTMMITETKKTVIKNLDKDAYERYSNNDNK